MLSHTLRLISLFLLLISTAFASVDINTASQSALEGLPGIGPAKATAIIEYRNTKGPFTDINQLDNVPGIGPATMANLRPLVTLGGDTEGASPSSNAETTSAPENNPNAININTASASVLEGLPGIGSSKAAAIEAYRNAHGNFSSCDALTNVHGIGPSTVSKLSAMCTTGASE